MKISSIIVTYKDRSTLLKQVVDALIKSPIRRIIIVDNNSSIKSKNYLLNIKKEYKEKIKVISLEKNLGSAYAFGVGIEEAINDSASEFLWLLDDDNLPVKGALELLTKYWRGLEEKEKNERVAIASFRQNKHVYFKAVQENNPGLVLGKKNIFRSFHIFDLPRSFARRFSKKSSVSRENMIKDHGDVSAYPYGGLFFHKSIINMIGLPDKKYYVYMDDLDFSHRIVQMGGRIILFLNSRITDIDESWNLKKFAFVSIAKERDYGRLYYAIRNRVYFEKMNLVDNKLIYFINMIIYSVIVFSVSLFNFRFKNIHTYFTAVRHGFNGKLGVNQDFQV